MAGVLYDFVTSLSGVFSMRHDMSFGSAKSCFNWFLRGMDVTRSARSRGFLSWLSTESRDAPRIKRERTGLVLCRLSTLLTARCSGVKPSQS